MGPFASMLLWVLLLVLGPLPSMGDQTLCSEPDDLRALYLDYSRVGKVFEADDDTICSRLAEVLKAHVRDKFCKLLSEARNSVVLYSYSSDATSMLCQTRTSAQLLNKTVVRKGKVLHEFLMQRGYIKCLSASGNEQIAILFSDPLPLSEGKRGWNMFEAGCDFFPS
jgi:hypothetical protein